MLVEELTAGAGGSAPGVGTKRDDPVYPVVNFDNDSPDGREDGLDRDVLAGQIQTAINHIVPPVVVGIYGRWGEGKTYMLHKVRELVETDHKGSTVWFDTWKHQADEDPAVAMLRAAYEVLFPESDRDGGPKDESSGMTPGQKVRLILLELGATVGIGATVGVGTAAAVTALGGAALSWLGPVVAGGKVVAAAISRWAPTVFARLAGLLAPGRDAAAIWASLASVPKKDGKPDTPEADKRTPEQILADWVSEQVAGERQLTMADRFSEVLKLLVGRLPPGERLVFFVDDLDRCLPEHVVGLLEKIKLFMDHPQVVFVIGADSEAVERAIQEEKKYTDPEIAGKYLEKIVQLPIALPPVDLAHKLTFINTLMKLIDDPVMLPKDDERKGSPWDRRRQIAETLKQAFDETDASVRQMVRTVNGFGFDHIVGGGSYHLESGQPVWEKTGLHDYDPVIMAVFSAVKVCYPKVYEGLREHHGDRERLLEFLFGAHPMDPDGETGRAADVPADLRREAILKDLFTRRVSQVRPDGTEITAIEQGEFREYLTWSLSGYLKDANPDMVRMVDRLEILDGAELSQYFTLSASVREEPGAVKVRVLPGLPGKPDSDESEVSLGVRHIPPSSRAVSKPTKALTDFTRAVKGFHGDLDGGVVIGPQLGGHQWRLLSTRADGTQALLLAEHVLEQRPYNAEWKDVTWEVCDLRHYLNGYFLTRFSDDVRERIVLDVVQNPHNPTWDIMGGNPTLDRVFLLSMQEAAGLLCPGKTAQWRAYSESDKWFKDQRPKATNEGGSPAWWWLRSPGRVLGSAADVRTDGSVNGDGRNVSTSSGGVRPAFWLNLEA